MYRHYYSIYDIQQHYNFITHGFPQLKKYNYAVEDLRAL